MKNREVAYIESHEEMETIIEFGALYKELNDDWVYGDFSPFLQKYYSIFLRWWIDEKNYQHHEFCDTDIAIRHWYHNIRTK